MPQFGHVFPRIYRLYVALVREKLYRLTANFTLSHSALVLRGFLWSSTFRIDLCFNLCLLPTLETFLDSFTNCSVVWRLTEQVVLVTPVSEEQTTTNVVTLTTTRMLVLLFSICILQTAGTVTGRTFTSFTHVMIVIIDIEVISVVGLRQKAGKRVTPVVMVVHFKQ